MISTIHHLQFSPLAAVLAVADLPTLSPVGATALARHSSPRVRATIAQHPSTPDAVRDTLTKDKDRSVKVQAFRRTQNLDLLEVTAKTAAGRVAAIAMNPRTPPRTLRQLAQREAAAVIRALLRNPSTPADVVLDLASRWRMSDLFRKEPTSAMSSGVGAVMAIHPEVAIPWSSGKETIGIRAIVRSPEVPLKAIEKLRTRGGSGSWKMAIAGNPDVPRSAFEFTDRMSARRAALEGLLGDQSPEFFCIGTPEAQLAAAQAGSHTLDIHLSRSGQLPARVVETILLRPHSETYVESDTLARLIDANGPTAARLATKFLAGTRLYAAAALSTVLSRTLEGVHTDQHGLSAKDLRGLVESSLGNDEAAWEVFTTLSPTWEGNLPSLIKTAGAV